MTYRKVYRQFANIGRTAPGWTDPDFHGEIDELKFFSTGLNLDDIFYEMNQGF